MTDTMPGAAGSRSGWLVEGDLRRSCRRLLRELDISPPLEPGLLCERLGAWRGRPVELVAHPVPAGTATGILLAFPNKDLILYQSETTLPHQAHIIFHEVAHLVLGHLTGGGRAVCGALLDPAPSERAPVSGKRRGATLYDQRQEWEAETAATILTGWTAAPGPAAGTVGSADAAARRFSAALGAAWEWR